MLKAVPPGTRERRVPVKTSTGVTCVGYGAETLLANLRTDPTRDYLVPPYVALLCAGIEATVNDGFIDFFFKRIGPSYQEYARPFIFLQFRDRCRTLIPLISDYRFTLNDKCEDFKQICKMIELRNQLLHVKQHWHPARMLQGAKGEILDFEYLESSADPYRDDSLKKLIASRDVDLYMEVFDRFIWAFGGLAGRIRRSNFNPTPWFVEIGVKRGRERIRSK